MPVDVTGGLLVSDRGRAAEPEASGTSMGFRAVLHPSLKISSNWFVSSTLQIQSAPFFYYEAFYPEKEIETQVQQLFLGYRWKGERKSFGVKIGKLASAFGAFPLRYSDTANPLLDQPFAFAYAAKLRPDQLPCGVRDLVAQAKYPEYTEHYCGGASVERDGMVPVTLYGIPGAEINIGWHSFDTRVQMTNSSPSNPQSLRSRSQHLQWTAGAGYTIRQGFRVGFSVFKGPFLENDVTSLLAPETTVRDYPSNGIDVDLQWGRGRWSATAEWNRVEFNYPRFRVPPAVSSGYAELKSTLTPRFYSAFRAGYQGNSSVEDRDGNTANHFMPNRQSYEFAVGYHLNHFQTLKVGYEWLNTDGQSGTRNNVFGIHFVTTLNSLSKAF